MTTRRGLGAGRGKGYRNLIPHDRPVHRDSGRGIKQPQQVAIFMARSGKAPVNPYVENVKSFIKEHYNGRNLEEIRLNLKKRGVPIEYVAQAVLDLDKEKFFEKGHAMGGKSPQKTISDLEKDKDLQFVSGDEATEIKQFLGRRAEEYDSFFVKEKNGEIVEAFGVKGNVPHLIKTADIIPIPEDGNLLPVIREGWKRAANKEKVMLHRSKQQEEPNIPLWYEDPKRDIIASVVGTEGNMRLRIGTPKGSVEVGLVGATPKGVRNQPAIIENTIHRHLKDMGYEVKVRPAKMSHSVTKAELIAGINKVDAEQGHFFPNGQYRYGVNYYYGKLNKYNKEKLEKILEGLKKTGDSQ